jgi:hypothetical protein
MSETEVKKAKRSIAVVGVVAALALSIGTGPASARKSVRSLRGGYFCRDLKRMGYSYGEALQYWHYWDEPDQMDADLNGIPCETVYTAAQVRRYFPQYSTEVQ